MKNVPENEKGGKEAISEKIINHQRKRITQKVTKLLQSQKSLELSTKTVKENVKKFKCNVCDMSFGQKGNLQTHFKNLHDSTKLNIKCFIRIPITSSVILATKLSV